MATDDKYDRQLRLWGAHGQKALMEANVCLLGSSPCATETLKNLVLPGIGQFVVVDDAHVEEADLGNNFFLDEEDVGKPRAAAVCRCVQELNPDVKGSSIVKSITEVLAAGKTFFSAYSLVIACQLTEPQALQVAAACEELSIGLVLITSIGFIGKLRLYTKEHTMLETKPDSDLGDLRLTDPFPELQRFAESCDMSALDEAEHAHVPYVLILLRGLEEFRRVCPEKHLPTSQEDKEQLKRILAGMQWNPQEGNFAEALENAYKAWVPYRISGEVQDVLRLETANEKADFWVVARAVAQFVRDCGKLPLAGTLPDMTASTEMYMKLQEIYASRADGDTAAISAHVATILKEQGAGSRSISQEFIKRFCKNAMYCEALKLRSLAEELRPCSPEDGGLDLAMECEDEESLIQWYIALRAADHIRQESGSWPGANRSDGEEALADQVAAMELAATKIVASYGSEGAAADSRMLQEIVRYGGSELHVTSAVLGGIAAQEAVKLLTKQYVPLNNTLIYDGLHGKMQSLEL